MLIQGVYHKNKGRYGYRRITEVLRAQIGLIINHKTVYRLLKELHLSSKIRIKKYHSYKGEIGKVCTNVLLDKKTDEIKHQTTYMRNFSTTSPNEKWVTDITEFKVCNTKIYLSPIIDLHDKTVLSYTISQTPNLKFVRDMLLKAIDQYHPKQLIFHSDQGWHYQHQQIQKILKKYGMIQSMSRKGNCLDNALAENFFSHVKSEFYYLEKFKTVHEFIKQLEDYIYYYNNDRISLKLKGMTPVVYRASCLVSN